MWSKVSEYGRQILSFVQRLNKNEEDIKEQRQDFRELRQDINRLRQEFGELARVVERLAYEIQGDRNQSEADRKILLLEIEARFHRFERALPPGEPLPPVDKDAQIASLQQEVEELKKRLPQPGRQKRSKPAIGDGG